MQAVVPRLADLVETNGTNVVEFYSTPSYFEDVSHLYKIDLIWPKMPEFFPKDNPQEEERYYHRDMCYVFDVGNDAQRSFRKIVQNELYYRNFYVVSLQEENIPSHRFPSTQDISATERIIKYTQRVNNRMMWIYEKGERGGLVSYLRYNHAPNVDMDTMQKDLERTLTRMPRPEPRARQG